MTFMGFVALCVCRLMTSVVDPDPYWIRIQELPGSGSEFRIRIPNPYSVLMLVYISVRETVPLKLFCSVP